MSSDLETGKAFQRLDTMEETTHTNLQLSVYKM